MIVEEKVKGWESYGWSEDFPHQKILVGWSRRQKIEEITNMGGLKRGDVVHFEINQDRQKSAKQGEVEADDWSTDAKIEMKDEYGFASKVPKEQAKKEEYFNLMFPKLELKTSKSARKN